MRQSYDEMMGWFHNGFNGNAYFLLYLICLVYLFITDKDKRFKLVVPSFLLTFFIINPVCYRYLWSKTIGYSYWRLFWTIPIIPVVALTFTSIISNGKTKWQRYGLVLILSFLALRSGCYLYKYPDTGFVKANNAYKLPQPAVDVADELIKNISSKVIYKDIKLDNTDQTIPLLSDVLKLVDGKVPLLIELKYDNKVGMLEDKLINIMKDYKGLYAFQSFSPFSLIYLKKHYPNVPRGLLVSDFKNNKINIIKKFLLKNMVFNFLIKLDFISVNYNYLNSKKIQKLRNNKLILTWTIRNNDDLNNVKDLCDNYIVENITKSSKK